jgi:hypothetical protein
MLDGQKENSGFTPTAATRVPNQAMIERTFAPCDFPGIAVAFAVYQFVALGPA